LYEADFGSGKIFRFDPTGNRSTFATGLSNPTGLAINSAGNLFEADRTSGAIYEFTPAGSKSAFASGLSAPDGLAFDRVGNLFVSNVGDNTITEIAPNGAKTTFASGLNYPTGLAFDSAGNLFEADTGSSLIYKFTPAGARSLFVHGGADGIAIDRTDVLFAAGSTGGLLEIQPDGTETEFASDISSAAFVALQPTPVPEPATYSVVGGLALLGFAAWSRRQR
jgi:DNA-binding beta-propeller fold protein YncE